MTDRSRPGSDPNTPTSTKTPKSETSVMLSLRDLMDLEQQRIAEENAAEERRRQLESQKKMEAELRIASANEAKRKAVAQAAEAEAQAIREREARLAAIREAAIVQVRVEAAEKARLEELRLIHEQEREKAKIHASAQTSSLKKMLAGVLALVVVGGAAAGYYAGVVKPRQDAESAALREQAERLDRQARAQAAELESLTTQGTVLQGQLSAVVSTPVVASVPSAAPVKSSSNAAPSVKVPTIRTVKPHPSGSVHVEPSGPCNDKDPMNFNLCPR